MIRADPVYQGTYLISKTIKSMGSHQSSQKILFSGNLVVSPGLGGIRVQVEVEGWGSRCSADPRGGERV